MDDEIPPRLPPRYSSLPRRSNGKAALNQWYDQSEPGPSSTAAVPQPFTRDYSHQSSTRSTSNPPYPTTTNRQVHHDADQRMGNGHSAQVRVAGLEQPRDWLAGPPAQQQSVRQGSVRPPSSANRRTELELAAEHSVLPEGPPVAQPKRKKSLKDRFASYVSFTITAIVETLNGSREENNKLRKERKAQLRSAPKRTQSLTRIDTRGVEEGVHRRTQSVRAPPRRREEEAEEMSRRKQAVGDVRMIGRLGLQNTGNVCYIAAAVQALRPVVTKVLMTDFPASENSGDILLMTTLFAALENKTDQDIHTAWKAFIEKFVKWHHVHKGEQEDASLALLRILEKLHDRTRRFLTPPTRDMLANLSANDQYLLRNRADENSPFYHLIQSIVQTYSVCFRCNESSIVFHNDILIPCVIPPQREVLERCAPLKVSFVRLATNNRCHNVRAYLDRYPNNLSPTICELKNQIYDHEVIDLFDLNRTEVFVHGNDSWDRLGELDSNVVGSRVGCNEFLSVIEFPFIADDRIVVLVSYGGLDAMITRTAVSDGPLFFSMRMGATTSDLRSEMRDYLRSYQSTVGDFFIKQEHDPRYQVSVEEEFQRLEGAFNQSEVVLHNIAVHKMIYPHLPAFIRICCQYDACVNDCVSLHRSAKRERFARTSTKKMDIPFLLKTYMNWTDNVVWRCSNNHNDRAGQVNSFCNLAEFIFIQIRRVDINFNGDLAETNKVHDKVYIPLLIDLAPVYRKEWPEMNHFETPRTRRPRMLYELVSTISHEGGVASMGHYTTYVYSPDVRSGFIKYNDDLVREANAECIHNDPFVVVYKRNREATFEKIKYGIVQFGMTSEMVIARPERAEEKMDVSGPMHGAELRQSKGKGKVQFDRSSEPRYHPDRPPADLKGSKRGKKAKK